MMSGEILRSLGYRLVLLFLRDLYNAEPWIYALVFGFEHVRFCQ